MILGEGFEQDPLSRAIYLVKKFLVLAFRVSHLLCVSYIYILSNNQVLQCMSQGNFVAVKCIVDALQHLSIRRLVTVWRFIKKSSSPILAVPHLFPYTERSVTTIENFLEN